MRRNHRTVLLFILFTLFASGLLLAKPVNIQVYLNGEKVPVRTSIQNNELYISVSDLSSVFSGQFELNADSGRLDIYSNKPETAVLPEVIKPDAGGIMGIFDLQDVNGKKFPAKNVTVTLFRSNPSIPDEASYAMIKRWALGKDYSLLETHGRVRETKTDVNGRFYMEPVPPGDYEIIAIYYTVEGKTGSFWRKKIKAEKDKSLYLIFDYKDAYRLD
jgi:hypothetical protein